MTKGVKLGGAEVLDLRLPAWRSRFVLVCVLLGFLALIARAGYLQMVSDEFLQQQGAKRMERTLPLRANRGNLLDRNEVVLAQSVPAMAIWYDSRVTAAKATDDQLVRLAKLLGMDKGLLIKRVRSDKRHFAYLDRQVEADLAKQIKELKIPGIGFIPESKRYYPQGEAMAHLIGFTNIEDKGQEGVELAFNDRLTGFDGERNVLRDRLGNVIDELREVRPAVDGDNLVLSVDSDLQFIVHNALKNAVQKHKAKAAAAVVIDAKTGELLAMANIPTYDPNDRNQLSGAKLRNRVFTDMFEPGSTLKPFTVALALDLGLIRPNTKIDTEKGRLKIGPATVTDVKDKGVLSVEEVIQVSSNVGTSKIALSLERQAMWENFHALGFGQAPAVRFPGAVAGIVRPWHKWRPIEQATMSYGHGISVSLIQLAQSYTVFANDGALIPVTLTKRDPRAPIERRQVFSKKTAGQMLHMLDLAASDEGTAPKAQVQGFTVAGKTGTAHKQENGKYVDKYISSFVGLAPVSKPRVIVAVMVDEPNKGVYYGGEIAAPVFSEITRSVLGRLRVQPDDLDEKFGGKRLVSVPSGVAL